MRLQEDVILRPCRKKVSKFKYLLAKHIVWVGVES